MYQRVKFEHHTFTQVLVGALTGILCAYLFYFFAQQKIIGIIKEKPDDNAPI